MDLEARLIDRWDDLYYGTKHALIGIGNLYAHVEERDGNIRILPAWNGSDLYEEGTDEPVRRAEYWERAEILVFAEEQFSVEDEMDARFEEEKR